MIAKRLRPAEKSEIDAIKKFLAARHSSQTPISQMETRLDMWWIDNPAMDETTPIGWILEDKQGKYIGFIANIPIPYQIFGRKDTAVASSSWYVKPEARGMTSLKLVQTFLAQKEKKFFIVNQPEGDVPKILIRFGLVHVPLPFNGIEYLHILNVDQMFVLFASRIFKNPRVFPILKLIAFPLKILSPVLNLIRRIRKQPPEKHKSSGADSGYTSSFITHCDESFTQLWEENKEKTHITLYRDSETLNWLYFSKAIADQRRVIQCLSRKDRKLAGYLVFDIIHFQKIDVKIFKLIDAYIPNLNESILSSLMSFAIEQAKKNKLGALRFWPRDQEMDNILRQWFKIRRKYDYLYYHMLKAPDDICSEDLEKYELRPSLIDPERGTMAYYSSLYF
jgi:hypothetical protein